LKKKSKVAGKKGTQEWRLVGKKLPPDWGIEPKDQSTRAPGLGGNNQVAQKVAKGERNLASLKRGKARGAKGFL